MTFWLRLLFLAAGLFGAAGVAAAAVSAHMTGGTNLMTAAQFLLFHAAALMGIGAAALQFARGRAALMVGASAIAIGTVLFSGDLISRALTGDKLLWGTAPMGGTLMIAGWLAVAIGGAMARLRSRG